MRLSLLRVWLAVAILLAVGIPPASAERPLSVYAVNYPLLYFAQRIAGEHADVVFPAPDDVDPAFWIPNVGTITAYQGADIILLNGAGYAKWVAKASLPRLRTVDTSQGFRDRYIQDQGSTLHSHGRGGDHSHSGTAFTTWLDFSQAAEQARAITTALVRKRPHLSAEFERNLGRLEADLLELDARMNNLASVAGEMPLLASHPVYQYLSRRYRLRLESVMWEPQVVPSAPRWRELEDLLSRYPAEWMLWEGLPVPQSVERLEDMGVGSLVFDPCATRPAEGDFLSVMRRNVENLTSALRPYPIERRVPVSSRFGSRTRSMATGAAGP